MGRRASAVTSARRCAPSAHGAHHRLGRGHPGRRLPDRFRLGGLGDAARLRRRHPGRRCPRCPDLPTTAGPAAFGLPASGAAATALGPPASRLLEPEIGGVKPARSGILGPLELAVVPASDGMLGCLLPAFGSPVTDLLPAGALTAGAAAPSLTSLAADLGDAFCGALSGDAVPDAPDATFGRADATSTVAATASTETAAGSAGGGSSAAAGAIGSAATGSTAVGPATSSARAALA